MKKSTKRRQRVTLSGLMLALSVLCGCQTWVAGMTLPSPHYLEHPPQYFPPSPPFPYERELASMEAELADPDGPIQPVPLPPQVPGGDFGGP